MTPYTKWYLIKRRRARMGGNTRSDSNTATADTYYDQFKTINDALGKY